MGSWVRIPDLIKHLYTHGQYEFVFEPLYLALTAEAYTAESKERAENLKENAREFLHHCEARRTEEIQRARAVLPALTWNAVIDTTDRALLSGRLDWLAKDGASRC